MATPTIKRKAGKIKSVGVHPCQEACRNGGYTCFHDPGVLTMIINIIVRPLNISIDTILLFIALVSSKLEKKGRDVLKKGKRKSLPELIISRSIDIYHPNN